MGERVDWEKRRRRDAMRVNVDPARDLLDRLGRPDDRLRVIHVAGTKGKGSVAMRLAEGLVAAGRRVGVYSSPHVERVTERVRIAAEEVADDALAEGLERALACQGAAEQAGTPAGQASWFDLMTAAGLFCMAEAGVEWAVLEIGLGGRLDSTNAADGELAIITSIDLEHTEILGSTRVAIATEKAGVLRRGRPLVCGVVPDGSRGPDENAGARIARMAHELDCPLTLVPPSGSLVETNRSLAGAALGLLGAAGELDGAGRPMDAALLAPGAGWSLPGRLEHFSIGGTPVVLDGAHVGSSLTAVLDDLEALERLQGPVVVVLAMAESKPVQSFLKALDGRVDTVVCTSVPSGIHRSCDDLAAAMAPGDFRTLAIAEPQAAIAAAQLRIPVGGWMLVTGSLYLVGAVRASIAASATLS